MLSCGFLAGIWRPAAPLRGRRSRMEAVNRPANACDRHIGAFGGAGLLDWTLPTRQPRRSLAPTTHGFFRVFSPTTNPDRFLPRPAPRQQYNRRFVNVVVGLGKKRSPNANT